MHSVALSRTQSLALFTSSSNRRFLCPPGALILSYKIYAVGERIPDKYSCTFVLLIFHIFGYYISYSDGVVVLLHILADVLLYARHDWDVHCASASANVK